MLEPPAHLAGGEADSLTACIAMAREPPDCAEEGLGLRSARLWLAPDRNGHRLRDSVGQVGAEQDAGHRRLTRRGVEIVGEATRVIL